MRLIVFVGGELYSLGEDWRVKPLDGGLKLSGGTVATPFGSVTAVAPITLVGPESPRVLAAVQRLIVDAVADAAARFQTHVVLDLPRLVAEAETRIASSDGASDLTPIRLALASVFDPAEVSAEFGRELGDLDEVELGAMLLARIHGQAAIMQTLAIRLRELGDELEGMPVGGRGAEVRKAGEKLLGMAQLLRTGQKS